MEGSNSILLHTISPDEFKALLAEVKMDILEAIGSHQSNQSEGANALDELITREETASYFRVNVSTIRNWTRANILQKYSVGDRVYYKRSEIVAVPVPLNGK